METGKLFIGPRLRALRLERGLTQTDFARLLGVSGSLVNLLERNQRSASLAVLMRLSDVFGLEMQELTSANTQVSLQQLRKTLSDPAVGVDDISIDELRSAMDLAPKVVDGLMALFDSYQVVQERLAGTLETTEDRSKSLRASEQRVHEFFQRKGNYFEELETIAQDFRARHSVSNDHALSLLSNILKAEHGTTVKVVEHEVMTPSVRRYDANEQTLYLSDALDHGNKVFQLAHWIGLMVYADQVDDVVRQAEFTDQHDAARARVALCDYFAAALLMPYEPFLDAAKKWAYDFERLAASFSVSYEQVCQRATTLQRPSNRGIPFFFLRVDKAGNVSKRFNASSIQLARLRRHLSPAGRTLLLPRAGAHPDPTRRDAGRGRIYHDQPDRFSPGEPLQSRRSPTGCFSRMCHSARAGTGLWRRQYLWFARHSDRDRRELSAVSPSHVRPACTRVYCPPNATHRVPSRPKSV